MKITIVLFFFTLCSILFGSTENLGNQWTEPVGTSMASEADQMLQALDQLEKDVKSIAKSAVRFALPFFMRTAEEANLSHSCNETGIQFLRDFSQLKPWTLRWLDSLGKPSSGLLNGMLWIRGNYNQCLKIEKSKSFKVKYCVIMIDIKPTKKEIIEAISAHDNNTLIRLVNYFLKPMQLSDIIVPNNFGKFGARLDVCLPSTCTEDDLNNIIKLFRRTQLLFSIRVDYCTTNEKGIKYTTTQIVSIIFVSVFFVLVALATTIDALRRLHIIPNNEASFFKNVISISAFTSGEKLFSDTLWKRSSCLFGIKTLVIFTVVFGHLIVYSYFMKTALENFTNIIEIWDYFPQEIANNGFAMLETFFFISGFLTVYSEKNEDRLWFRQILIILKRIIRLGIPAFCVVAIHILFSLIVDGPHSYLFIRFEYLLAHTWFITALVQLIIFTSPFVFILNRWPECGKLFFIILILSGFISYASIIYIKKISFMFGYSFRINQFLSYSIDVFMKPYYSHLSTYCFGLLIGSVVARKTELTFRKEIMAFLWIVASVLLGLAVFGLHSYIKEEFPNENIMFVHRIFSPYAWTVGIAWVCVACITGNGGVINWFLSLKVFVVFDRLNIWIFLLHPILILYSLAQLRTPHYISEINMWMLFVFVMFLTVIASAVVYIFLQTPLDFLINKIFDQNCLKRSSFVKVYNKESASTKKLL